MGDKITVEVEFEVGTLAELGFSGFHVGWLNGDKDGVKYDLDAGAGCGNPYLEAVAYGEQTMVARADMRKVAGQLFRELGERLAKE